MTRTCRKPTQVHFDVTAARTRGEKSEPASAILASVAYGIAAVDRDLRYVYANEAALAMVGLPLERVLGCTPAEIFPAPLSESVTAHARRVIETGQPLTYDVYYETLDRWYENRLFPSQDGAVAFFSDITDRKRAEQELRSSEASHRHLVTALRESRDVLSLAMRGGRMGAWSRDLVTGEVWRNRNSMT